MDIFQYEMSSMAQGHDDSPFTNKQWVWVNDNNNGAYGSNSLTFDLSSLYNAQKFIGVNEMYLEVPLVVVLSKDKAPALAQNDYALGFKNGYYNLIDSMNVVYDSQTVQQQCTHSNFYTSFKINSSIGVNDLQNIAPSLGIYPDSSTSWQFSATAGTHGIGIMNNQNYQTSPAFGAISTGVDTYNKGLLMRQHRTAVNFATKAANINANLNNKFQALQSQSNLANSSRNNTYLVTDAANHLLEYQVWYVMATIRLGDISSFFNKMPLTKGVYARLNINLNIGSCRIAKTNLTTITLAQNDTNFPYQTCPFMVAPLLTGAAPDLNNALNSDTAHTEIVFGLYVSKVTASVNCVINQSTLNVPPHNINACRIYAPMYTMEPQKELKYISENRNKYIEYDDIIYTPYSNVPASGGSVNFNVTNTAINPKGILVIPMLSQSGNGGIYPHSSPFTTEPATSSPLILHNFNVQMAGENMLNQAVSYDYEMFLQNVLGVNSINGSSSWGMSSGVIDQTAFENNYRYYYVDLERRAPDNVISKSITLQCINDNLVTIDLHIFVIVKKSIVIDVQTGKIVSQSQ